MTKYKAFGNIPEDVLVKCNTLGLLLHKSQEQLLIYMVNELWTKYKDMPIDEKVSAKIKEFARKARA